MLRQRWGYTPKTLFFSADFVFYALPSLTKSGCNLTHIPY
jgi:hypothetical protein